MSASVRAVALIPARAGSKRVPGKNVRPLNGVPLMAYTIRAAIDSGVFDKVIVSSDSCDYLGIAADYGALPMLRPEKLATDLSPDYEWVSWTISVQCEQFGKTWDAFSILRPTSPFRQPKTIRRAWEQFCTRSLPLDAGGDAIDSLRAMEPATQHPYKMWTIGSNRLAGPFASYHSQVIEVQGQPAHSCPTQLLPAVYVQNASLEIAWTRVLTEHHNISGERVAPFFTKGWEGFDINDEIDFELAEHLVASNQARLPEVICP